MTAVAGWLTIGGGDQLCDGGNPGKPRQLRHGSDGVHDRVKSMGFDKPGKRGLRATTCGGGSEHKPANDADQDRNGQP